MPQEQKQQKKRPYYGGGMPKGHRTKKILAKEQARERLREILTAEMEPVAQALVSRCRGVRHFVTRNKTGKYEIVTDPDKVLAALNQEDAMTGEFYTEKPETAAIKEFFDRTVDKSKDQALDVNLHVMGLEERIRTAQERVGGK